MDYADVRQMALMLNGISSRFIVGIPGTGLIFACDSGEGRSADEFGDYFASRDGTPPPGHDTPGGNADRIKDKVSSSIASLFRRPRVWVEGIIVRLGGHTGTADVCHAGKYCVWLYVAELPRLITQTHGSFWE